MSSLGRGGVPSAPLDPQMLTPIQQFFIGVVPAFAFLPQNFGKVVATNGNLLCSGRFRISRG